MAQPPAEPARESAPAPSAEDPWRPPRAPALPPPAGPSRLLALACVVFGLGLFAFAALVYGNDLARAGRTAAELPAPQRNLLRAVTERLLSATPAQKLLSFAGLLAQLVLPLPLAGIGVGLLRRRPGAVRAGFFWAIAALAAVALGCGALLWMGRPSTALSAALVLGALPTLLLVSCRRPPSGA